MNRFFIFTEEYSARFLTADADGLAMRQLQASLGEVVIHDSTHNMPATEIQSTIRQALVFGYREVAESEFKEQQAQLQKEFELNVIDPEVPNTKKVAWHDLAAEHESYFHNGPAEYLAANLRYFHVYAQSCRLLQDLKLTFSSMSPTPQTATRNLIFNQGLTIDGNFDAGDNVSELPLLVVVKGDLHAKNLILTGWTEVVVTGNLVVDGTLLAMDGEAGGRLHVMGDLTAKRILGGMMYHIEVAGQVSAETYWSDDDEPSLPKAKVVPYSLSNLQTDEFENHTPLVAGAYFIDSNWATGQEVKTLNLELTQMVALIREGKAIFH